MWRTVIERTADDSFILTREACDGLSGNAQQRRKQQREGTREVWKTKQRAITKSLAAVPPIAKGWFNTTPLDFAESNIAADNAGAALIGVLHAEAIVAGIEFRAAAFKVKPATNNVRVIIGESEN